MIRHIVFFTVQEEHLGGGEGRTVDPDRHSARAAAGNRHQCEDRSAGYEIDLVVYGEFDDEAALAAYKAHPDYQRSIERVRPLREKRIAADYNSRAAVTRPL